MTSSKPSRPIVRLKPKADAARLRRGQPWVYADDVVTDRRTRAIQPGALAVLQDAGRSDIGLVAVNAASKIMLRRLDDDPNARIDLAWFEAKIARALALREQLYDAPFYRLIHAEADGLPGVIIDRFGETCVIQPNAAWAQARLDLIAAALKSVVGLCNIYKNASGRTRELEGLDAESGFIAGEISAPVPVTMNGATYIADITGGQKPGCFTTNVPITPLPARLAKGADMLDVFSHVGGFGLAALAGGARSALAVDGSAPALALAEQGAEAMGVGQAFSTIKGDAFKVMEALQSEGRRFGLVVADPPAFAPSKKALQNGLTAYSRVAAMAARLVAPGGYLVLCSCSHAADLEKFRQASLRGIARAERAAQLIHTGAAGPDHPVHFALTESAYLKALFFPACVMRACLDACVLFPTVLREILIGVAGHGLYEPVWSERILEEWVRATTKLGPEAELQARSECAVLRAAFPQAEVAPRAGDLDRLVLPDDNDVHVLASAIASSADILVTLNAKDFPKSTLRFEGVERLSPDALLMQLWLAEADAVEAVVAQVHATAQQMLGEEIERRALLKRARLPRLGKALS